MLPTRAGVYRIAHEASGYVYVGSSLRLLHRFEFWRDALYSFAFRDVRWEDHPYEAGPWPARSFAAYNLSRRWTRALCEVGNQGWTNRVVEWFPDDVSGDVLAGAECREIEAAMAVDRSLCLNAGRIRNHGGRYHDSRTYFAAKAVFKPVGRV